MSLREWARRHAASTAPGNAVQDLLAGRDDATIARDRGLPRAAVAGVRTFYDQLESLPRVCDGTACRFAGAEAIRERLAGRVATAEVRCLGHCYDAPAVRVGDTVFSRSTRAGFEAWLAGPRSAPPAGAAATPIPRMSLAEPPHLLRDLLEGPRAGIRDEYALPAPGVILESVESYGLRGRGGAAFPAALKWKVARDTAAPDRVVVANGDEGDPGSFVDRLLLEDAPHLVLSGMLAVARVIGARTGIVYVRAEYPRAQAAVRAALAEARAAGHLGEAFDIEMESGAGSYVVGEETAMLNSIEGLRGEPRIKPPYPSVSGLWGLPTVVQNVETLALISHLARTGQGDGTKLISLAGAVDWPGVVEVPLGTPLRRVLIEGGGGPPAGRRWSMAIIGGPLGRVLPERRFDTPLAFETLPGMGHGGVVVLDTSVTPGALARHIMRFARAESCGNCTPCRVGTSRLAQMQDRESLERLLDTLQSGSLCGFGAGVPLPLRDLLEHFGDEVFA
jgi:NADH:ubiquinone oxidoreductase subunit F (NADH-binding)